MLYIFLCGFIASLLVFILAFWVISPYVQWKARAKRSCEDYIIITAKSEQLLLSYMKTQYEKETSIPLSLVVPCYNEEKRLPLMLKQSIEHFEKMNYKYEIIIVNEGSRDKTTKVALAFSEYNGKSIDIKVIESPINHGKGGSVRIGCLAAFGEVILMADADGASEISEFEKCLERLDKIKCDGHGIVTGSRSHDEKEVKLVKPLHRRILSKCSSIVVKGICGINLRDTQCGFKLFTNKTAKHLFKALHITRWAFDVELFIMANYSSIPYCEVPISYIDQPGSKMNLITDAIQMARDYILIRLLYLLGLWKHTHSDNISTSLLPDLETKDLKKREAIEENGSKKLL